MFNFIKVSPPDSLVQLGGGGLYLTTDTYELYYKDGNSAGAPSLLFKNKFDTINSSITNLDTRVTNTETSLNSKANQSDLNTLSTSVIKLTNNGPQLMCSGTQNISWVIDSTNDQEFWFETNFEFTSARIYIVQIVINADDSDYSYTHEFLISGTITGLDTGGYIYCPIYNINVHNSNAGQLLINTNEITGYANGMDINITIPADTLSSILYKLHSVYISDGSDFSGTLSYRVYQV